MAISIHALYCQPYVIDRKSALFLEVGVSYGWKSIKKTAMFIIAAQKVCTILKRYMLETEV